ncbi:hypothetical protein [Clostridium ganghwense]|uniref:Restriction endonuclease type IV Mrr domain-containing protein n=1 Tax=Clostridium ganghwense TaxID=312089 RepID=A0ABT4CL04_9CLOT|nr:hypothetical protein [Clostridium ganghwense]MCY6369717.1 hypothetical protein [Clostridium ganghwense]
MLNGIFDFIYFKIKRKEIKKAKYRLRRLKINTVLELMIKNCKEKNVNYNILEHTKSEILIELIGKKYNILLKYDRRDMVFNEEFDSFVDKMKKTKINKGIYITTGLFEGGIHKRGNRIFFPKNIILEDYSYFMKRQLGLRGKTIDVFKNKKLNFYKYLPR